LPTSGGRSVGIVRSRTKAMEFGFIIIIIILWLHGPFSLALASLRITVHSFLS
jgi:hypothetical protein